MKTQLLLADDHVLFRHGLRNLLDEEPGLKVVGEASDGQQVLELLKKSRPDLLICDVLMPRMNGIETVRLALEAEPGCRALMLSGQSDSRYVGQALEAGASGFLTKACSYAQLLEAIAAVCAGKTYLGPEVAAVVVERYVRKNGSNGHGHGGGGRGRGRRNGNGNGNGNGGGRGRGGHRVLSPRERQVLQLLAEGYATKQIAAELNVSAKTIDTHRGAVMRKLEIDSIAHLTKYAVREGITTLNY